MKKQASVRVRSIRRLVLTLVILVVLLFSAAGSLRFWQGWVFIAVQAVFWTYFFVEFLKRDPKLLERRLESKEATREQKWFQKLWVLITIPGFELAGFDFRFGWTRGRLGPVPVGVVVFGQAGVLAGYWIVYWVMKTNTFAASTIRVEAEQHVIDAGPYALVRHPMYFGMAVTMLAAPLALGSYVALPWFALTIPLLVFRLVHEERLLRRDLAGYQDYCQRTQYRLVPWVW